MKPTEEGLMQNSICIVSFSLRLMAVIVCMSTYIAANAQLKKAPIAKSIYYGIPANYAQVGGTDLYYYQTSSAIDIIGKFGDNYYSSTYSNGGYKLAMQVGNSYPAYVDCLYGTTIDGVTCTVSIAEQGELAKICYTVVNNNDTAVNVSLGTHADVMIGNNDRAPISRKNDTTTGSTYGLSLKDGNGAELCVLFGAGLNGVTAVNDFWFGLYSQNRDEYSMIGNYSEDSNYYMQENGSYDSGMGWCWKNRRIEANTYVEFTYLIGVGDVTLEPSSDFVVTPDDPQGWNDLSRPHRLELNGTYESPAGIDGIIEYAIEDSEEWLAITDTLTSGEEFTATIVATFDPQRPTHVINFRITDVVGNTSLLAPIEYLDISFINFDGIENKTYTGDSIYQTNLTCELDKDQYVVTNYNNNINSIEVSSTTASFYVEGVFPYTIGRKKYNFTIYPADFQTIVEGIYLSEDNFTYTGSPIVPEWTFVNADAAKLEEGNDYTVLHENNIYPGQGTVNVNGVGNYTGTVTQTFIIDKATLADSLYTVNIPNEDICFDNNPHPAEFIANTDGIGEHSFTYLNQATGEESTTPPSAEGSYVAYLEVAEGDCFYGLEKHEVGSFTIYHFDENEWLTLVTLCNHLSQNGWVQPWNTSLGITAVSTFDGLTTKHGHVTGIDLSECNLSGELPLSLFGFTQLEELNLSKNNLTGDIGNSMMEVKATGISISDKLRSVDISDNRFNGNIGQFAMFIPSLESLKASGNRISDVYPPISANVTTLEIGKQDMENVITLDLGNITPEILTSIPTLLLYEHETQSYKQEIDVLCTVSEDFNYSSDNSPNDWAIQLSYQNGQLTFPYTSEQNAYYGKSGDTLHVFNVAENNYPDVSKLRMKLSFPDGDANFTGNIDITDLQTIILRIFDNYNMLPFNFTAANMIKDEAINIQDVVGEVNLLLSFADTNTLSPVLSAKADQEKEVATANIYCFGNKLIAYSTEPIAAFDIFIDNAHSLNITDALKDLGMVCSTRNTANGIHIVGYSLSGGCIPIGETTIATFNENNVNISAAVLSNSKAERMKVSLVPQTTGIGDIQTNTSYIKLVDGKIIINTDDNNDCVKWQVARPDGRLIDSGIISNAGRHTLEINEKGVLIITIDINGNNITKKIIK